MDNGKGGCNFHTLIKIFNDFSQVNNSFSVNLRCYHSITATSLGFGLTEVLVFGGREEYGTPMAETIVLRFGKEVITYCIVSKGK